MPDGVKTSFMVAEALFLGTGVLLVASSIIWMNEKNSDASIENVARTLLLDHFPFPALIANGAIIFITLLLALPAFALPTSRGWLKAHSWFVVICATFTLVLGLNEWIQTLQLRANLEDVWGKQSPRVQSLLQQKFDCCGYIDFASPRYAVDTTCPNDLVAATKLGCVGPFSSFSEKWLNLIFTAAFGVVGLDFILLLCIAMVIKGRKEQLRYRRIDEKRGVGSI